jgi:hypothetical protein
VLSTDHVLRDAHAVLRGPRAVLRDAQSVLLDSAHAAFVCSLVARLLPDDLMLRRSSGRGHGSAGRSHDCDSGGSDCSGRGSGCGRHRRLLRDSRALLPHPHAHPIAWPSPTRVLRDDRCRLLLLSAGD